MRAVRHAIATTLLAAVTCGRVAAQPPSELVVEQQPFVVYSAFWPNLHHVLYSEAWRQRTNAGQSLAALLPEPLGTERLSPAEQRAWAAAIAYYDRELADQTLLFDLFSVRRALLAAGGALPEFGLAPEHRRVLAAAAPVYEKHWWQAHDRANREWAAALLPRVADLSPAVVDRLRALYGTPWFDERVRVDVVRVSSYQGAYTDLDPEPAHITVSSSDPNEQGWAAVEILFHEASHALIQPISAALQMELRARGKRSNDLWHVVLFYVTGEVVRETLASRGVDYEPYLYRTGLFDRAWPRLKGPVEHHWPAYVKGDARLDDVVAKTVADLE
jgi:hypothetical protein